MHEPQDDEQDEAENGKSLHGELQESHGDRWWQLGVTLARERELTGLRVGPTRSAGSLKCPSRLASLGRRFGFQRTMWGSQEPDPFWRSGDMDTETSRGLVVLLPGSRYELEGFVSHQTDRRSTDQPGGVVVGTGGWVATANTPLPD